MIVSCKGSGYLFGLDNGDFIRDGISFYYSDSVLQEFVPVFDTLIFNV